MDHQDDAITGALPMSTMGKLDISEIISKLQRFPDLWILVSLGVALRLFQLGSRPIWYDEAIAILVSRSGFDGIIRSALSPSGGISANVHPPLYFATLRGWMQVFGESPFAVRFWSVILSVFVMLVIWEFSRKWISRKAAAVTLGLYAFSPFQVHYGQEARMYVMMSLFLLSATWAMWQLMDDRKALHWIVLGTSSALAVYTQALAAAYLLCLFLLPVLLARMDRLREVLYAGLLALTIYAPWLLQLPAQLNKVQGGYWTPRPGIVELIQTLITFSAGLPLLGMWLPVGLALSLLLFVLLLWQSYRLLKTGGISTGVLAAVIFLTIAPVVLLFLLSQIVPVFVIRALLTSGALFLIWVALITSDSRVKSFDRGIIFAAVLVLFVIGLLNHYQYRGFPYAPFREMNRYIENNIGEDGVVVHSNKITMLPAYYYDPELPHSFIQDPPGSGSDTLAAPTQQVIGIRAEEDIQGAVAGHEQVFFVIFDREIQEYELSGVEIHPALEYLGSTHKKIGSTSFGDVRIFEFREPQS